MGYGLGELMRLLALGKPCVSPWICRTQQFEELARYGSKPCLEKVRTFRQIPVSDPSLSADSLGCQNLWFDQDQESHSFVYGSASMFPFSTGSSSDYPAQSIFPSDDLRPRTDSTDNNKEGDLWIMRYRSQVRQSAQSERKRSGRVIVRQYLEQSEELVNKVKECRRDTVKEKVFELLKANSSIDDETTPPIEINKRSKKEKRYPIGIALVELLDERNAIEMKIENKEGAKVMRKRDLEELPLKINLPMVCPPLDWEPKNPKKQPKTLADLKGGYLIGRTADFSDRYGFLNSKNVKNSRVLLNDEYEKLCMILNALQKQAFKINEEYLKYVKDNYQLLVNYNMLQLKFLYRIVTKDIAECREGDNVLRSGDLCGDGYGNPPQMDREYKGDPNLLKPVIREYRPNETTYWITPVRHEAADAESAPMPLAMPCLVPRHGGGSVARHEHRAKGR
nr:DNA-dependent RNA polymerase, mitochondrial [Tanacetum cinerariifolium]